MKVCDGVKGSIWVQFTQRELKLNSLWVYMTGNDNIDIYIISGDRWYLGGALYNEL